MPIRGTADGPSSVRTVSPADRTRPPRRKTRSKSVRLRRETNRWLRREALPTFRSATPDDFSAGTRMHSRAEAVSAFPASALGLVRSFHDFRSTAEGYGGAPSMSMLCRSISSQCGHCTSRPHQAELRTNAPRLPARPSGRQRSSRNAGDVPANRRTANVFLDQRKPSSSEGYRSREYAATKNRHFIVPVGGDVFSTKR